MNAFGWKNAVGKQIKAKAKTLLIQLLRDGDFHYQDLQNGFSQLFNGTLANLLLATAPECTN